MNTFTQTTGLTEQQIRRMAPSVFTAEAHESRGERYKVIPTWEPIKGLLDQGFVVTQAMQSASRKAGGLAFAKHLLRLRPTFATAEVGDIFPEICLTNSHDGTSSYRLHAGLFRIACQNGMVVGNGTVCEARVQHRGQHVVDDVIEGTFSVVKEMPTVMNRVSEFQSIELSRPEQLALANAAIALRWGDENKPAHDDQPARSVVVEPVDVIRALRRADDGADLWTTFNVIQEKILKGGVPVRRLEGSITKSRQRSRAVGSVTENVALNKALWALADEMAKIKAG